VTRPRSLGLRLVLWFVLLGIGPAFCMALVAYFEVLAVDEENALGHLVSAAQTRAGAIGARLGEYRNRARVLMRHDLPRVAARQRELGPIDTGDGVVGVVAPDGRLLGAPAEIPLDPGQLVAVRQGEILRRKGWMILGIALKDGGAAVVLFPERAIFGLVEDAVGSERIGDTFLVDADGQVLAGHRDTERNEKLGRRVALPERPGDYTDERGRRMLVAWAPVGTWRVAAEMERAEVVGFLHGLAGQLLWIGAVAFLIVMGALLYAGRRIDRSVTAMVASLERAARGEFGGEIEGPKVPASEGVGAAINEMHRRLKERDAQITSQRQQLFCQRCELERLNAEIIEADRMKSEFVANMSHEVRTPLHSILSLSSVLLAETTGGLTDEQRRQVETIERNGGSLLAMLGDILDFSKIEAGRMTMIVEEVAPGAALAGVREAISPLAASKGLDLVLDSPEDLASIRSDAEKLHRALLNLAHNAVKFTDEGSVTLRCRPREDGGAIFSVIDTGPGIPREEIARIFEPFLQVDGSRTRARGGTGLGLTIAKSLGELLGGRIGVASKPGQGTTFTLALPPEAPTRMPGAPRMVQGVTSILVVGATAPSGNALRDELQAAGFRASRAGCGRELSNALSREGLGGIVLDVGIFESDGLEVPRAIASRLQGEEIPVFGYWLEPQRRVGCLLGEVKLELEPDGACRIECGKEVLRLPRDLGGEHRDEAAAWAHGLTARRALPFHEVVRELVSRLDPALRRRAEESARVARGIVFVVDPDPDARYSLSLQVEQMGYSVYTGAEMDELPTGVKAAAVVAEARLPGVDDPVAALGERTGAPVVVLTADARPETRDAAVRAGAASVLVKPATHDALSKALAAAMQEPVS
jgi:signal transduction histidine kinase/DNA-binding response OmpR family regulator